MKNKFYDFSTPIGEIHRALDPELRLVINAESSLISISLHGKIALLETDDLVPLDIHEFRCIRDDSQFFRGDPAGIFRESVSQFRFIHA